MTAKLLRFVLTDAGYQVVLTAHLEETLREAIGLGTDALLLENDSSRGNCYELCKELRGYGYHGPVLFIGQSQDTVDKLRAFECGADDYIVRPFDPMELIARIESTARRFKQAHHQSLGRVLKVGDAELSIGDLTFRADGRRPVLLTPTEMRLLECLMRNSSITISRDTLIDRAWGHDFGDTNRVDVYIGRLRKKIERDPARAEYIHTVRGAGYVFRPPAKSGVIKLRLAPEHSDAAMSAPQTV